jgi:hypothetical protein
MAQQQNTNTPTNSDSQVSFADVSLSTLKQHFKNTYKVSKGSASQVVLGFSEMSERLGTVTENEYQQNLYPKLKEFCTNLVTKYSDTFLTAFTSDVEKQVFGANLNGNRNTGSLYKSIPSGVNRNLTYNYAQFKQLVRVLTGRLRFVVQRDPNSVQRYKENQDEFTAYQKLQESCKSYLTYLDTVTNEWNTVVSELRTRFAVTPTETQHTQHHERPQRTQRTQRPERTERTERTQRPERTQKSQPQYKQVRSTNRSHQTNGDSEWQTVRTRNPRQRTQNTQKSTYNSA